MLMYSVKRLLTMVPLLLIIALLVTAIIDLTPGDPVLLILGADVAPGQVEETRAMLGLDDPFFVRYFRYVTGVLQGDLGTSLITGRPVTAELFMRFPNTFRLALISTIAATLIGIPIGVYAATKQYTWKDNAAMFLALFFVSMPAFWLALMLIRLFAVQLRWLPTLGIATWQGWVLPCAVLAVNFAALMARQMRSNLLEVIRLDFMTTARSKGLPRRTVLYKHGLKNAIIPIIQVIGNTFVIMLSGSMITEIIFSIPGVGHYVLTGLRTRDYPIIQGSVMFFAIVTVVVFLLTDIAFASVDPRIRSQFSRKIKKTGKKVKAA